MDPASHVLGYFVKAALGLHVHYRVQDYGLSESVQLDISFATPLIHLIHGHLLSVISFHQ